MMCNGLQVEPQKTSALPYDPTLNGDLRYGRDPTRNLGGGEVKPATSNPKYKLTILLFRFLLFLLML